MNVVRCSSSIVQPWRRAAKTANRRSQLGIARRRRSFTGSASRSSRVALESSSSDADPFSSASWKVEPIDIASPTDFIAVPSVVCAPGNFSNAQRGILTTV